MASATVSWPRVRPAEARRVCQQRVGAVEKPQLPLLERGHVVDERSPGLVPGRPPSGKRASQDPLGERLGHDGAVVQQAGRLLDGTAVVLGGSRRDPVDHGGHEGDLVGDPAGQRAVHAVGAVEDHAAYGRAVPRQVVAGHHRERSRVGSTARGEARDQPPRHAADRRGGASHDRLDIGADLRMVDVQPAVVPAQVRPLGDRQSHHACRTSREGREPGVLVGARMSARDAAHHVVPAALGRLGDQRVEALLLGHLVGELGASPGERCDTPRFRVRRALGVRRLVGAEETAETEVDVAYRGSSRAVTGGPREAARGVGGHADSLGPRVVADPAARHRELRTSPVVDEGAGMTEVTARSIEVRTLGDASRLLPDDEVRTFVEQSLAGVALDGRRVCVLVPDATRSCPLPLLLAGVHSALAGRASEVTVLVALGTHAAMDESALASHLGYAPHRLAATYPAFSVHNHEWGDPETFVSLGSIPAARIEELSEGRLHSAVDVRINRMVVEHDVALVVGPVFPHEVVGFSGGDKYFFPGVCGQEVIDLSHWLGALITSADIIGTRGVTPVRALIHEAASMIPSERLAVCVVARSGSDRLYSVSFGDPQEAWAAAADVSAEVHVEYLDEPVRRVVAVIPEKYDDMWTAAKGFYKVEPVVADGGEVILYAPHITRISAMHPEIDEIGYHGRDYFTAQRDRFSHLHWGVLAHSTHLRGAGTYDAEHGERLRVTVTLATGIPADVVRAANLEPLDPATLD